MRNFLLILVGVLLFFTASAKAQESTLKTALVRYVRVHSSWPGALISVDNIEIRGDALKNGGFERLAVSSRNGARTTGRVSFNVSLFRGVKGLGSVVAVADVAVKRSVVVAETPVKMREEIGPEDVSLAFRDISKIPVNAALLLSDVVGKEAKRPIQAGRIVREDYLVKPLLVRRGQGVEVRGEGGPIVVKGPRPLQAESWGAA